MDLKDKPILSIRLIPDDHELIQEFLSIHENSSNEKIEKPRELFIALLETAISRKKPIEVSKESDVKEIKKLKEELIRFEKLESDYNERIEKIESENKEKSSKLTKENEVLLSENQKYKKDIEQLSLLIKDKNEIIDSKVDLKENEYLISLTPVQKAYLLFACKQKNIQSFFIENNKNGKLNGLIDKLETIDDMTTLLKSWLFYSAKVCKHPLPDFDKFYINYKKKN
jgi:hypothetical protein